MMNTNTVTPFLKFSEFLLSTGFLQRCLRQRKSSFTYGPAGHLLRKNIQDTWWQRMVTKSETCFPVEGKDNEPHFSYHSILEFVNNTLPFSIAHVSSYETEEMSIIPSDLSPFIDTSTRTNLQFIHFCSQALFHQTFDQIIDTRLKWWKQYAGNSSRFTKIDAGNMNGSPYFNIQYKFPWGEETIESVVKYGDKMAQEVLEKTGNSCMMTSKNGDYLPQCITSTMSLDTAVFVYLSDGLDEKKSLQDPNFTRQIMQLHPAIAPFKVAITQDGTKDRQLNEVSTYISRILRTSGIHTLYSKDTKTPIKQQIDRHDRIGIPFTVVVTDNTLQIGAIELRNRDTTLHETLAINKLADYVLQHLTYQG